MSIPDNPWLEGFHFEVHCPGNGYSMNDIWKEAAEEQSLPDETSLQLGYPLRQAKASTNSFTPAFDPCGGLSHYRKRRDHSYWPQVEWGVCTCRI
jgi:hypothetical protein